MGFFKKHTISIIAVVSLLAVGCYESYWLHGVYKAAKEALMSTIDLSVVQEEVEEYLNGIMEKQTDTLRFYAAGSSSKIISVSMDTLKIMPRSVSVYKAGDLSSKMKLSAPNVDRMDSKLRPLLDSAGLHGLEYSLAFAILEEDEEVPVPEGRTQNINSHFFDGYYTFSYAPLTKYIFGKMGGSIAISAGLLVLIAAAFCLMGKTVRKQRELEVMKSDFTQNMTHELKTPIAVAYAANDALLECGMAEDADRREEYLGIIREQLGKLGGMVDTILSTTTGNIHPNRTKTALRPLLEKAAADARMNAGKTCKISVSVKPENLEADIDGKLMSLVFATMLDNAVKYSGKSVEINVEARMSGRRILVEISDNGIGMAAKELAHIFEKFYRVHTGDKHDVKGYGIGLFFAREIIAGHGGKISVRSEPGKGSSFTIELPNG